MISTSTSTSTKPQTVLQKKASKENFALRQLKGMQGNLIHLQGVIAGTKINALRQLLELLEQDIRKEQAWRKVKRESLEKI